MLDLRSLLKQSPLPDQRLRTRAQRMVQSLLRGHSSSPSLGLLAPADCTPGSFTRGSYRFLDNDFVQLPALQAPVAQALAQLVPPSPRAYVAHDLSILNFSGHQAKQDLIPVGNEHTFGYELYQALVLTSDGRPLGSAVTELRNAEGLHSSQSRQVLPFTDHLEQTERAVDAIENLLPGRELVHLCDREFDDLKLLRHLGARKYVIRAQHLRRSVRVHGEESSLQQHLLSVPLSPCGEVLRGCPEGKTERYQLYVGQTHVTMYGPSLRGVAKGRNRPEPGEAVSVRVVLSELRKEGRQTLRWVLLTNLTESALGLVQAYLFRWKIERQFWLT